MNQFNLIIEPWIPVRYLDGRQRDLSIRDTFAHVRDIGGIEDASPLIVAALHRFLVAVLYRALHGPTDRDDALKLFQKGLPNEKILAYLEKWRDRFFLFDDRFPFQQIPTFEPKIKRAWTVLASEHNADNAKVLFDHVDVSNPGDIPPSTAAKWVLATQTFSVSAGKSELSHTGTAPSATSVISIPTGKCLEDTLLFCLVPQNRAILESDIPIWERTPESIETLKTGPQRRAQGFADLFTWRTRSIRLFSNDDGKIGQIAFASGIGYKDEGQIDPMLGYRVDDKKGKLPVQFRQRGLWRDFDSLLPTQDGSEQLGPRVIEHAIDMSRKEPSRFPKSVLALGQSNDKAKIEFWRMEQFALPESLLGKKSVRSEIKEYLLIAEDCERSLWNSLRIFAGSLLSRGGREPHATDVRKFVLSLSSIPWYWSCMEVHFHKVLSMYTLDKDPEEIELFWYQKVQEALSSAWTHHEESISVNDAWAIRALAKARTPIVRKLGELKKTIADLAGEAK